MKAAATVIVIKPFRFNRSCSQNSCKCGQIANTDFEVLMIKRSENLRSFPGAHVFPGGVLEKSDIDSNRWRTLLNINTSDAFGKSMITSNCEHSHEPIDELSFRIAAIRELFEETNLLLSNSKIEMNILRTWRALVQKDHNKFFEMFQTLGMLPNPFQLIPFAHWVTPITERYRYNTLFYLAILNEKFQVDFSFDRIMQDHTETISFHWWSPKRTLQEFEEGKVQLLPPTWTVLKKLAQFESLGELEKSSKDKNFMVSIPIILPRILIASEQDSKDYQHLLPHGKKLLSLVYFPGLSLC